MKKILPYVVFVYGTLKSSHGANMKLDEAEFLGPAVTPPLFQMRGGGFPALFLDDKGHQVRGEAYAIDDETFKVLDQYEGYPSFYNRTFIPIVTDKGEQMSAWVYFIEDEDTFRSFHEEIKPDADGYLEWS